MVLGGAERAAPPCAVVRTASGRWEAGHEDPASALLPVATCLFFKQTLQILYGDTIVEVLCIVQTSIVHRHQLTFGVNHW